MVGYLQALLLVCMTFTSSGISLTAKCYLSWKFEATARLIRIVVQSYHCPEDLVSCLPYGYPLCHYSHLTILDSSSLSELALCTCTVLQGKGANFLTSIFEVKRASLCLITSTDVIKTTFIVYPHIHVRNREAIQTQAVFEQLFMTLDKSGNTHVYQEYFGAESSNLGFCNLNTSALRGPSGFS